VYLKAGNYAAAREDFDTVIEREGTQASSIERDGTLASSLYGRGLIKRHAGDTAGADADIAKAVKIKPDVAADIAPYGLGE